LAFKIGYEKDPPKSNYIYLKYRSLASEKNEIDSLNEGRSEEKLGKVARINQLSKLSLQQDLNEVFRAMQHLYTYSMHITNSDALSPLLV
jgi:hypothetical protein